MSFEQSIDGQAVEFFSELDYLYCKAEYLESKESKDNGVSCLTFLEFLQFELYDHDKCLVVKISDLPPIFTIPSTIPSTNYLTFTANDSAIYSYPNDTDTFHFEPGFTDIGPISNQIYHNGSFDFTTNQYQLLVDNDGVKEEEEKKEEESSDDPIEERFDILDL